MCELTLGEFRKATADMSDESLITITIDSNDWIHPNARYNVTDYDFIVDCESVKREINLTSKPIRIKSEHHIAQDVEGGAEGIQNAECELIKRALEIAKGNRTEAAYRLGMSSRTLCRKIREYNL